MIEERHVAELGKEALNILHDFRMKPEKQMAIPDTTVEENLRAKMEERKKLLEEEADGEGLTVESYLETISSLLKVVKYRMNAATNVLKSPTKDQKLRAKAKRELKEAKAYAEQMELLISGYPGDKYFDTYLVNVARSNKTAKIQYRSAMRGAFKRHLPMLRSRPGYVQMIENLVYDAFGKHRGYAVAYLKGWFDFLKDQKKVKYKIFESNWVRLLLIYKETGSTAYFERSPVWQHYLENTKADLSGEGTVAFDGEQFSESSQGTGYSKT